MGTIRVHEFMSLGHFGVRAIFAAGRARWLAYIPRLGGTIAFLLARVTRESAGEVIDGGPAAGFPGAATLILGGDIVLGDMLRRCR